MIDAPHCESGPETWDDPDKVACFVPAQGRRRSAGELLTEAEHDQMPSSINGIPVASWTPPATKEAWQVMALDHDAPEVPTELLKDLPVSAGFIVVERSQRRMVLKILKAMKAFRILWVLPLLRVLGILKLLRALKILKDDKIRVWLAFATKNHWNAGISFTSETLEEGETVAAAALRGAYEELGLRTRFLPIPVFVHVTPDGTHQMVWVFMERDGGEDGDEPAGTPADMGWESQAVFLVPLSELREVVDLDHAGHADIIAEVEERLAWWMRQEGGDSVS